MMHTTICAWAQLSVFEQQSSFPEGQRAGWTAPTNNSCRGAGSWLQISDTACVTHGGYQEPGGLLTQE